MDSSSVTSSQLQYHPKQITLISSSEPKLSNQTSTTARSTPISDDFEQYKDLHQIHSPKEDFIRSFFKKRDNVIKKMAQISQQTDSQTEQRRLIFIKPHIQEALEVQNLLRNNQSVFNRQALQDITNEIELSFKCLKNLRDFYQNQTSSPQDEKMRQTSHMAESTWQQIYKLSIYDPVLINEVSRLEWIFRAIEVLSHKRTDSQYPYIQYCKALKQGAIESKNEEIMESKFYKRIEGELHKHQSLIKKVNLLSKHERGGASVNQEQKMDVEEAKQLLKELKEFGFGMSQEITYVEEILTKALKIEKEFFEFLNKKALTSPNDLHKLTLQIRSFPLKFLKIEEQLNKLFKDQEEKIKSVLQDTAGRIVLKNRDLYFEFLRYSEVNLMMAEEGLKVYKQQFRKMIEYSAELIQDLEHFKFESFDIMNQKISARNYEHIKAELWLTRVRLFRIFCKSIVKPFNSITYEELHSFLPEIKDYLESLPEPEKIPFHKQIVFLYRLFQTIKAFIRIEREKQEKNGKRNLDKIFYGFIDVTEEIFKPTKKQQKPADLTNSSKKMKIKGSLSQFGDVRNLESLNKKRSRIDEKNAKDIIDSYEKKVEKKMKKQNEINPLVFRSSGIEIIQKKSQPEKLRIEKSDNVLSCLEELPKKKQDFQNELFEEEKFNGLLDDFDKNKEKTLVSSMPNSNKIVLEKMKEAEEFLNEFNQEMLFDENFVLENNALEKSYLVVETPFLDRLNNEFWNGLGDEFKIKKKDNLANTQGWNAVVLEQN